MLNWYGERCPTFEEMEAVALNLGVQVAIHPDFDVPRYLWDEHGDPWVICIPSQFGPLARLWALAHELGHIICHGDPPIDREQHRTQEAEADEWAACALIPGSVFEEGGTPTPHHLVYFLRKHYQAFTTQKDDRVRALAYRIAFTRMKAMEEVA